MYKCYDTMCDIMDIFIDDIGVNADRPDRIEDR